MPDYLNYILIAAAAYGLGSLNGSLMTSRFFWRDDIRGHGSGSAGATNVLRTYGVGWTVAVSLWDMGKGVLAVWLARWLIPAVRGGPELNGRTLGYAVLLAGFCAILGHSFPLFFKFRGGKGVFTSLGVFLAWDWRVALLALSVFLIVVLLTRYVSLGSVCAGTTLPFLGLLFGTEWGRAWITIGTYAAVALLLIFLHRANIKRLISGTENKLSRGKKMP